MKTAGAVIVAAVFLTGCATTDKVDAIRKARDSGLIQGMDKDAQMSYVLGMGIPNGVSETHPGPYRSIDQMNVKVHTGLYAGKNATFFLGKSRKTGEWEVFSLMIQKDKAWALIPVQLNEAQ